MTPPTRRAVLSSSTALLAGLAGCGQPADAGGTEPPDGRTDTTDGGTASTTQRRTSAQPTPELDLREANVVGVELAETGGSEYRFDVTLYHDDDGEDGYANWWQVETLAGEQLGRRELLHEHSTDPFTRSETIAVPGDVDCVVVRGHDQTHGYGGQAMLVAVPGGATRAVQQGPDPTQFDDADCP
ncbi:hypothetical protein [Haloarcula amylovorans]|uniref:hypothetical protein n=1 Tax=Haloarcula amylovorans TaxID=2562280 RepID=UPI0010768E40|nr:hypothetical protein [Halomicroarcula amylolytica]